MNAERFITASPSPTAEFDRVEAPEVSVVTVTYGTGAVVVDMLASLSAAAAVEGALSIEVIVVDNPHPDMGVRTVTDLRLFTAGVTVIRPERNLGFGGGCEAGLFAARSDVVAFVNPDVVVGPGWLEPLLYAASEQDVAIAAPVLVDVDGTVQEAGQRLDARGQTTPILAAPSTTTTVDYASAACWVMRRSVHEQLGGFDPAYHPAYFEDVDLALRARVAGLSCVVVPEVTVVHHGGAGVPGETPPASAQRDILRDRWPAIAWTQPRPR